MSDALLFILVLFSALGCGLIAGAFFAFSVFVMKALARLPTAQGSAAMQSINVVVINPLFLGVFLGTAVTCAVLAASSLFVWHKPYASYLLAGGLLYLAGTFLVTMMFNVPRNNVLASVDPESDYGDRVWRGYVSSWTGWNHVRTVAALAAMASLIFALRLV